MLPSSTQIRVKNLAVAGEAASDSETAWFVLMWAGRELRRIWWWKLPQAVLLVGAFAMLVVRVGAWALAILLVPLLHFASIWIAMRLRRAIRANEPVASGSRRGAVGAQGEDGGGRHPPRPSPVLADLAYGSESLAEHAGDVPERRPDVR
jgi:hypothetical protein